MEQHNIDSRFKKGLENLDRQPSADAWARLQSQLNAPEAAPETITPQPEEKEEKRILLWWHYAAAAVVLLFISVGIIKNGSNFNGKTAPELAVNQAKEMPAKTEKSIEIQKPEIINEVASENAVAQTETPTKATEKTPENAIGSEVKTAPVKTFEKQFQPETENALALAKPKKKRAVIVDPEKLPVAGNKTAKPEESLLAANTNPIQVKPEIQEVKPSGLTGGVIEVIVKKDHSENMVAANVPAPETDKDSKLKTIFKQARNFKNGEKVDLQALGVNTDSKLAMGTRSLTEKFTKVLDI